MCIFPSKNESDALPFSYYYCSHARTSYEEMIPDRAEVYWVQNLASHSESPLNLHSVVGYTQLYKWLKRKDALNKYRRFLIQARWE